MRAARGGRGGPAGVARRAVIPARRRFGPASAGCRIAAGPKAAQRAIELALVDGRLVLLVRRPARLLAQPLGRPPGPRAGWDGEAAERLREEARRSADEQDQPA